MTIKTRNGFSLVEVLMSLVTLATLSIIIVNLESRILINARRFHNKLIRLLPLANSLNSITLLEDLNKGLEKKEFGPETKILLKLEKLEKSSLFFEFNNLQKITAEAIWAETKEELVRWVFIYNEKENVNKPKI